MIYLDWAWMLVELAAAMYIADRILLAHYLPRVFGFYWVILITAAYAVFAVTHPWGLIVALGAWPIYRLSTKRRRAHRARR
jgi:hypothetical protein